MRPCGVAVLDKGVGHCLRTAPCLDAFAGSCIHRYYLVGVLAALLVSCGQGQPVTDIDPKLGLQCFESHRAALPPGTQYEGIEKLVENRLTIRIMNGVEVVTIDCALKPDGAVQPGGED